jgi:hypothetical protein
MLLPDGQHDHRTRRLNPGIPIPPEATAIHRLTDADVAHEPTSASHASVPTPVAKGKTLAPRSPHTRRLGVIVLLAACCCLAAGLSSASNERSVNPLIAARMAAEIEVSRNKVLVDADGGCRLECLLHLLHGQSD